jgi:hypothetical protein
MSTIWAYIMAHQTVAALVAYYIVSAFIGSLPSPKVDSGQFYQFFFKFINTLGGNLARAFSGDLPVAKAQTQGVDAAKVAGVKAGTIVPPKP